MKKLFLFLIGISLSVLAFSQTEKVEAKAISALQSFTLRTSTGKQKVDSLKNTSKGTMNRSNVIPTGQAVYQFFLENFNVKQNQLNGVGLVRQNGLTTTYDNNTYLTGIANGSVTFSKLQNISGLRLLGNPTGSAGIPQEMTGAQVASLLPLFNISDKGLVPQSSGVPGAYLDVTGNWSIPPGTGGIASVFGSNDSRSSGTRRFSLKNSDSFIWDSVATWQLNNLTTFPRFEVTPGRTWLSSPNNNSNMSVVNGGVTITQGSVFLQVGDSVRYLSARSSDTTKYKIQGTNPVTGAKAWLNWIGGSVNTSTVSQIVHDSLTNRFATSFGAEVNPNQFEVDSGYNGDLDTLNLKDLGITDNLLASTIKIGDLTNLTTTAKNNVISAINELNSAKVSTARTITINGVTQSLGSNVTFTANNNDYLWSQINKTTSSLADITTRLFSDLQSKPTTISGYGITDAQPLDGDLTAIAAISSTGILRRTGASTWTVGTTVSTSEIADAAITGAKISLTSEVQGSVMYRNASGWVVLAPGSSGQVLTSGGTSANVSWTTIVGGGSGTDNSNVGSQYPLLIQNTQQIKTLAKGYGMAFDTTNTVHTLRVDSAAVNQAVRSSLIVPFDLILALGDETTDVTTGNAKVTFRAPRGFTITGVRASVNTASSSGLPTVDINENGTTILSTKLSIDASEKTSVTAATAAVISDSSIADDAEITLDVDVSGTGAKGLKVIIYGYRSY